MLARPPPGSWLPLLGEILDPPLHNNVKIHRFRHYFVHYLEKKNS